MKLILALILTILSATAFAGAREQANLAYINSFNANKRAQNEVAELQQRIDQLERRPAYVAPQPSYQQQQMQQQQLRHGAGGCTPNFATGGCL